MKEIFTDLYNKVLGFFQTQEKEAAQESKNVAVNRMKLVLMQDRTNLTPFLLEKMRGELIDLLSRYVEMDKEMLELNFAHEGDSMALMLSIPVIRAREEEEINELLQEEEKVKREKEKEETDAQVSEEETSDEETSEEAAEETQETDAESDEESGLVEVCACGCQEGEECTCSVDCECEDAEEDVGDDKDVNESNKKFKK